MKLEPVAIVTGATRGIGKSIVERLSLHGVNCVGIGSSMRSISNEELRRSMKHVSKNQRHRLLAIDFSEWPTWVDSKREFQGIEYCANGREEVGDFKIFDMLKSWNSQDKEVRYYLSLLINCAGITQESLSIRTDSAEMKNIMNINLLSPVSMCNLTIKNMIKDRKTIGADKPRYILNVSSVLGKPKVYLPGTSLYSASKAGLGQYSNVLEQEVSKYGIITKSVQLGPIQDTDMVQNLKSNGIQLDEFAKRLGIPVSTKAEATRLILDEYLEKLLESGQVSGTV
ncbi:hypothetical protein Kpol_1064p10 [Vanderwaltozyma polyspora DSM 70294]|uniref:3-oxoacyl-[acyl-carrier-protein] reductase n=1 Tax=Vanderwaltozyma polyspora (strain ATCC 22028 / DSM 70294 / BCRC 21397 / CBS 2163 / NBRC 10782 / NRRL Y-8283 / UCD 57-17) TaxID=436907 RepID=A7TMD6_VANPO|nr:uncharacterized protein Kpol_1064p10 [Vanderwaltozyma polyspora DSM 70294]EDO16530.1 hypothetical protein Kpol_1064p10 [Vanderwaltozyma polyspora DSM 70294]